MPKSAAGPHRSFESPCLGNTVGIALVMVVPAAPEATLVAGSAPLDHCSVGPIAKEKSVSSGVGCFS